MAKDEIWVRAFHHRTREIKCSINDHFSARVPVPVVFFYRKRIEANEILHAMQNVLTDFPLFAGVLVKKEDGLYIHCNNRGVLLTIAHKKGTLVNMIKPNNENGPLLTVKLSYYDGGVAIGFCWHHSVGDMATFMEFIKAVSAFTKKQAYPLPVYVEDREKYIQQFEAKNLPPSPRLGLKRLGLLDLCRLAKSMLFPKKTIHLYFTPEQISSLRDSLSKQAGKKVSRNEALCAYLLQSLKQVRNASIAINIRSRLNMPFNVLGNFIDIIPIKNGANIAPIISAAVKNYVQENFRPSFAANFIQENGGLRNIHKMIPQEFLPQHKNLIITNWSNFDTYTIDFGVAAPYLVLPTGESPIPWVCAMIEGYEGQGTIISLLLPANVNTKPFQPYRTDPFKKSLYVANL